MNKVFGVFEIGSVASWQFLLIALILLALCFIIIQVKRRLYPQRKNRLALVVLFNLGSTIAVLGLFLPITQKSETSPQALLFTTGVSEYQLAQYSKKYIFDHQNKVYALNAIVETQSSKYASAQEITKVFPEIHWLDSVNELLFFQNDLQKLTVVGDGLNQDQWYNFKDIAVHFDKGEVRTGVTNLSWKKSVYQGEQLTLAGRFQSINTDHIYHVTLLDLNQDIVSSTPLKHGEHFKFSFIPKSLGQLTYQLKVTDGNKEVIQQDIVAIHVERSQQARILIKQSSPSFETKHLKDWLSQVGGQVFVITDISKGKSITQSVNLSKDEITSSVTEINENLLSHFDLMLIDGKAILQLSIIENQALLKAVQQGLGLLILADDSTQADALSSNLLLKGFSFNNRLTDNTEPKENAVVKWSSGYIEQPISVLPGKLESPQGSVLMSDHLNRSLIASHSVGFGRISLSLLNTTYQWKISGLLPEYSRFWQYLIKKLARNFSDGYWLALPKERVMYQQNYQQQCILSSRPIHHGVQIKGKIQTQITFNPVLNDENKYCANFWLNDTGWQSLTLDNNDKQLTDESHRQILYAYPKTGFLAWQQAAKHIASVAMAENSPQQKSVVIEKQIPKALFWWLLLICSTFLWLERKFFN